MSCGSEVLVGPMLQNNMGGILHIGESPCKTRFRVRRAGDPNGLGAHAASRCEMEHPDADHNAHGEGHCMHVIPAGSLMLACIEWMFSTGVRL